VQRIEAEPRKVPAGRAEMRGERCIFSDCLADPLQRFSPLSIGVVKLRAVLFADAAVSAGNNHQ